MKKIIGFVKNQRGVTLVELLAVVVILGILAGIAVPSIGGIIDNSKKDAHIANAEQMVSAARLAKASNLEESEDSDTYSLGYLVDEGFMELPSNPGEEDAYIQSATQVEASGNDSSQYIVTLVASDGGNHITTEDNNATIQELRDNGRDLISVDGE